MKEGDAVLAAGAIFVALMVVALAFYRAPSRSKSEITATMLECNATCLDWGAVEPGETVSRTVAFRARGACTLNYTLTGWSPPEAERWLRVSWSYNGSSVGETWFPVAFFLAVSEDVTGVRGFNFTVNVFGS